jgi:hypothetical protein
MHAGLDERRLSVCALGSGFGFWFEVEVRGLLGVDSRVFDLIERMSFQTIGELLDQRPYPPVRASALLDAQNLRPSILRAKVNQADETPRFPFLTPSKAFPERG